MSQIKTAPVEIAKEDLGSVKFAETDVLDAKQDIFQRKIDLERASALGAQSKQNVKLYFMDNEGKRHKVVATVWATTADNVSLKGSAMVPIKSIYKVGFF